jgi:hypothetical protein
MVARMDGTSGCWRFSRSKWSRAGKLVGLGVGVLHHQPPTGLMIRVAAQKGGQLFAACLHFARRQQLLDVGKFNLVQGGGNRVEPVVAKVLLDGFAGCRIFLTQGVEPFLGLGRWGLRVRAFSRAMILSSGSSTSSLSQSQASSCLGSLSTNSSSRVRAWMRSPALALVTAV